MPNDAMQPSPSTFTLLPPSVERTLAPGWPIFQATAGATIAWLIARQLPNHADPFFAPISVIVALNAPWGERGTSAVRLVSGVMLGIAVAEVVILVPGPGYARLSLAMFVAMALARAFGNTRLVIVQAGASAILTVAVAGNHAGFSRLIDACVGALVALFFSQVLFSPEPIAMLRRAESSALAVLGNGLDLTGHALESGDEKAGNEALSALRALRDQLAELGRLRHASGRVARHSVMWRTLAIPVVREAEHADELDLLSGSCVILSRTALTMIPVSDKWLAVRVRSLGAALTGLAANVGDREARQRAAEGALAVARQLRDAPYDAALTGPIFVARLVAFDIMVFAGASAAESHAAIAATAGDLHVAEPPQSPRLPFHLNARSGA